MEPSLFLKRSLSLAGFEPILLAYVNKGWNSVISKLFSELQERRGNTDNSEIFFFISWRKYTL